MDWEVFRQCILTMALLLFTVLLCCVHPAIGLPFFGLGFSFLMARAFKEAEK